MAETQTPAAALPAVRSSSDLATLDDLERILVTNEDVVVEEADADAMSTEIVKQLLAADSDEQLEQFGQATGWSEMLGIPIEIQGFRWRPSDFEEGPSIFFVVFGTRLDTGDPIVLTTGSRNVMAQLCNMARRGTISGAIREAVQADKPTKRGFYPLWLRSPAKK